MSTRIADLEIKISNEAKGATSSLDNLVSALNRVEEAKKSLDFSSVTGKSNNGFRQLYKYVQSITKIMKPLATEMEKISKGFGVLGIKLKSTPSMGADKLKETSDSISEKMAGKGTTAVDTSAVGTLVSTADRAMDRIDLLRQKLDMLKQKYNELASDPNKAYQANSVALQIQNVESMIQKLEEGEKATTGFAVGMQNVGTALMKVNVASGITHSALGRLVSSFGRLLKLKLLRMIVMEFYKAIGEGIKNLYEYSRALGSVDSANFKNTMDSYSTSMQTLKNSIGAMIGQVITAMLPTIQTLINYLTTAINVINQFFAALQGKAVFTKAKDSFTEWAENTSSSAGGASESIKELQRTILAFDELNVLNSPDTGGGGGGGGGGASTPDYTDMFEEATISDKIKKVADKVKEIVNWIKENFDTIWAIVSNIGLALLAWKIATEVASFFGILDKLGFTKNAGKIAFGITLSLVGFAIEATGAFDIGKNGANLRNIIQTALGGALGVLGGVIAFGAGSVIVTIPLAIMVAFSGFKVGEGVARLENDEEFQKWSEWVKNAKEAQSRVDEIVAGLESKTSSLLGTISSNVATAQALRDRIFEIVNDNGKLKAEFEGDDQAITNLTTLIEDFNKLSLSDIQLEYNDLTGEINLTRQEVENLIETYKKQAQTEAYLELYKEHYKAIIELQAEAARQEQAFNDAQKAKSDWEIEHLDRLKELMNRLDTEGLLFMASPDYSEYVDLQAEFMKLSDAVKETGKAFDDADEALKKASGNADVYWDLYEKSATGSLDAITGKIDDVDHSWNELEFKEQRLDAIDGVTPKIEEIDKNYGNAKDHIERSPAQLKAQNLVTSVANEAQRDWINKNFPAKGLTATNKVGTAVNEAYNTWTGKNFPSKGLSVSTGAVTDSMNYVQRYWKNLDMSKGISATVTMSGTRIQFNGYAEGGFPDYGSIFIAGEAGAEMVGNINGRTGVASQGEITGIRQSVEATGNTEARLLAEQNALLRQILAKEGNVTVSTSAIIDGLNRTNRRAGKTVVSMG